MSNVVSSKYGDRQLIHLPPVTIDRDRTPAVPSLAPRGYDTYRSGASSYSPSRRGTNQSFREHRRNQTANIIPREYAYPTSDGRVVSSVENQWPGQPTRPNQGNLVMDPDPFQRQRYAEPAGQPPIMTYTPQAMAQVQGIPQSVPAQMVPFQQPIQNQAMMPGQPMSVGHPMMPQQMPVQAVSSQPMPYQVQVPASNAGSTGPGQNPNEKHIYYGPNGEILPGPPQGFPTQSFVNGGPEVGQPRNFSVDGVLEFGVLKTMTLSDGTASFPRLPQYLTAQLHQKYGQFERTNVKIVSANGEFHVHATPQIPGSQVPGFQTPGQQPQGMPPPPPASEAGNSYRRYRTPAVMERSYPFVGHDHAGYRGHFEEQYREDGEDPISELRWRKEEA